MKTRFTDSHFVQSEGVIYELHPQIEAELIEAFDKIKGPGSSAKVIATRGKALSSTIPALSRAINAAAPSEEIVPANAAPVLPADARIKVLEDQLKIAQGQLKQEDDRRAESREREILARNGGVLPPKDFKIGNESLPANEAPTDVKGRLAQYFKIESQ